jgi:hypothetical protein
LAEIRSKHWSMDIWRRLIEFWQAYERSRVPDGEISPNRVIPSSPNADAILAFEVKYRVTLPVDLRGYFSVVEVCGSDMGPYLFRFWPLQEFKPVQEVLTDINPDRYAYPDCFAFADFLVGCCDYAVRISEGTEVSGPVFRVTGDLPAGEQMADSFVEFFEMYLADPTSIM